MTLKEFIKHLAHKSLKVKIICYDYNNHCFVTIYEASVGELLNWVKYPIYMDYLVECVNPEDTNFMEVKIYG